MRTFFIWLTGVLASAIVLGITGNAIAPHDGGDFWGIVAGALGFTCFRLWTSKESGR